MTAATPYADWNELGASTDFRDVFRYKKGGKTRTYKLRALDDGNVELWVFPDEGSKDARSRKIVTFINREDIQAYIETIEQELRKGGWS